MSNLGNEFNSDLSVKHKFTDRFKFRNISTTKIIARGFLILILVGAILLSLPIASRSGRSVGFLTALFTATSASCVTGLVLVDTYQNWTAFGQIIIIILIQIGGLGFMTFGVTFSMLLHKNIGLKQRYVLQESINSLQIGGIIRLTKKIVKGTIIIEGTGAILLALRFMKDMVWYKAIYYGVFHSISAFCNAGFDLMGYKEEYSSFVSYSADPLINIVLMLLIIVGGIGFVVWDDLVTHKFHFKAYRLHTKLVLTITAFLITVPSVLFYLMEKDNLMKGMGVSECIFTSLFSAVTARTAGFNTIDTGGLTAASKLLTVVLMFIGGSPGSTAGGIKTTTMAVMLLVVWANLRSTKGCNVYGRRLNEDAIRKASIVFTINLLLAVVSAILLLSIQPFKTEDAIFEVFSAIGTVGMTTGITRQLNTISRIVIIILMYCGRIGSVTFALFFTEKKNSDPLLRPVEKILIG